MITIILVSIGTSKSFFWLIPVAIAKVVGVKHGAAKVLAKGAKEVLKEKAKNTVTDAIQNKDDKKKDKQE